MGVARIIGTTLIIVLTFTIPASADTGWGPAYIGSAAYGDFEDYEFDYEIGDYVAVSEHPSVRMADERVDIYLHKCGAAVNAEFRFVDDGKATTVDMFYPLTWGWKSNSSFDFELYIIGEDGALNPIDFDVYENPDGEYEKTARWAMPFESGEEITVLCRYVAGYGWDTEGILVGPRWELKNERDEHLEYGLIPHTARYIISTGGAWNGPIGHGTIAFHTTNEIVWEDLINYKGKLHLNDSPNGFYTDDEYIPNSLIPDETLNAFKRNDNIEIKIVEDSLIVEFDDLEAGSESFEAVSNLLGTGLPIAISGHVSGDLEVSLAPSASSTLPDTPDYWYRIRAMGYSSTGGFHAWSEGVPGIGEGEWVKVEIYAGRDATKPARLKGIHFYGGFHTGREHPQNDLFNKNGAPSAVTVDLYRDNKVVYTESYNLVELSAEQEDSFNIGSVYLGFDKLIDCDEIKVAIDEVRPGSEWNDTCISGIEPIFADGRVRHTASSCLVESLSDICRFHPIKIDDGRLDTCWVEGVAGNGVGEWVELEWESPRNVSGVTITPGFADSDALFYANSRPKRVKMELFSGQLLLCTTTAKLPDINSPQDFPEVPGGIDNVKRIRITIEEVYAGSEYEDTCITEIEVY